jgi:hypothetical protein
MRIRRLERWRQLEPADRSLLLRSAFWIAAARLALWVLPLRTARRLLARPPRPADGPVSAERIAWAISVARRVVPAASCLPQALAAEALLARHGHPVELRIGVTKTGQGGLLAHAWVESRGRVVVGDLADGLSRYTPLPPLPAAEGPGGRR